MKRLGFGTLRLPMVQTNDGKKPDLHTIKRMVDCAISKGIYYFDCAPTYCEGLCEKTIGFCVKENRSQVYLASKIPLDVLKEKGDLYKYLKLSLERLQTDYLDYYYFWGIKKEEFEKVALENSFLEEMNKAKEEGLIHHMGFSFHDSPEYAIDIVNAAKEQGCPFDMMMCQYNLLDRNMEPYIEVIKKQGLQIFVMGAAAGGKLDYQPAYTFVWNNSNVDCLVSGFRSEKMIEENIALLNLESLDYQAIKMEERAKSKLKDLYCTECGYCMPCPAGIDIPRWMNLQQEKIIFGQIDCEDAVRKEHIKNGLHPMDVCLDCGFCEKKCPQGLHIRNYIKESLKICQKKEKSSSY